MNYSLHIGLNYTGTQHALNGCVNDAQDMEKLFRSKGYKTQILLEQQATKAGIFSAIQTIYSKMDKDSVLFISNSSHGTYIKDANKDEIDGKDECMVPWDCQHNLIVDDEFATLFGLVKNHIIFVSDSCHSESLNKIFNKIDTDVDNNTKKKFTKILDFQGVMPVEKGLVKFDNNAMLSGCKANEYSYDAVFNGRPNGALTRAFLDKYKDGMSIQDMHKAIYKVILPNKQYPQTPMLTGKTSTKKIKI